ncbi:TPA: hypothetical protein ACGR4O_004961 [Pseudomonas aeruginosa]|uniref:Uncharacterized protein n=1 Tax=Pseudomonas paraeruginosa TaxID=2994495 RepID=A0A2R3IKN7_9PSED|nr:MULTISPECIES: hypothetical protein [Pseudomonas aeruginosa group]AVK02476.1 hypothetical protein CSB93_6990 [Pseudomonas paraeruginosa]AWE88990.1 hypothetical protein CSC28_7085 [Pseudomonas paraeruginosa]ERX94029.1 hypothetical protein Q077_06560 [Pseudomonas aeruginosa BL23]MCS7735904.1 hypothetical protein [Pseudomonas aeruginosa]MCS8012045.1 hypothetical protein [Pseudomonas aeruginosa]
MEKNDAVDVLIAAMTDAKVLTNQLSPLDLRTAAAEALGQASA